jgi:WD40 repeat protein
LLIPDALTAAEPPKDPKLRIETGMHTAMIRRVVHDEAAGIIATGSDDKTVRVWRLRDGKLLRTLRFPIGDGHEGRVFSLALSPDGDTLAVSGWTGVEWDRRGSIYLFNIESGQIAGRITGLTSIVGYLAFSPDGDYLAVGLANAQGLKVFRVPDYELVSEDSRYRERIGGIDFSREGMLAVACLDGLVRLYDRDFRLIARAHARPGKQPVIVRFSPDDQTIAVGFVDTPQVGLLSAENLELLHAPPLAGFEGQVNLTGVVWSHDGETLYAYGDFEGEGRDPVHRWAEGGYGAHSTIPAAVERVTAMRPLSSGGMLYVTEDPSIGFIDAPDGTGFHRQAQILNFRPKTQAPADSLAISHDGAVLQLKGAGAKIGHFRLPDRQLNTEPVEGAKLYRARTVSDQVRITDWKDSYEPKVNGKTIALDDFELSRCAALAPDGRRFALGSEWALRFFDGDGELLWRKDLSQVVWQVVVSGDGDWVVAALSDGTIRWYRPEDGVEVLALFVHANMKDWIAWTPDGYYVSSPYGDNYVGWHLNRGKAETADFFRAVQFERILYRPDIVRRRFESRGQVEERSEVPGVGLFDISQVARIAPPRISISELGMRSTDGGATAVLRFQAEKRGDPMDSVTVFVNNIPVSPSAGRALQGSERQRFEREMELDLPDVETQVRIEVWTRNAIGVTERYLFTEGRPPLPKPGDLYVLAVGVSRFPGLPQELQLPFAARDARELAGFFRDEGARKFSAVHTRVLADQEALLPTAAGIRASLDFVTRATANDTVLLFLASHGFSNAAGDYYFLPRDAAAEDLRALLDGSDGELPTLISWRTFFEALRGVAGRRLLVVDTCNARGIAGTFDQHSLAKRSAASSFSLLAASKSGELSREYPQARHGLFTYALLRGLAGRADRDRDRAVTLAELFDYVGPFVSERLKKIGDERGSQTPQLIAPAPLGETVLSKSGS